MNVQNYQGRNIDIHIINELADAGFEEVANYYQRVQSFLQNIEENNPCLTPKQEAWLDRIVDNYESQYEKL